MTSCLRFTSVSTNRKLELRPNQFSIKVDAEIKSSCLPAPKVTSARKYLSGSVPCRASEQVPSVGGRFSATASQDLIDIEEIDHTNYYEKIKGADAPVVIIDFYTQWCGPCKLIYPTLLEMKEELEGKVTFYKFNCNKPNKELGQSLDIRVAPTFIIYKGEEEYKRLTGAKIPPLRAALEEAIAA